MKEVKQREDSITEFKKADRTDLVEANEQEIAILRKYLPEQLSDEDLKAMVQETIAATGAKTMKDMGKVMGAVMAKAKGRAEGGKISAFVRELLK
ncbi:MAG: GatB/YqeY domain-containing protein [Acidaminococcaceae bacterium]|nr:GatB/YqeY domain-containing protein [Acidaminococcaceae bacterium]